MEMYIKRSCKKLEVRNSNTTLHTSKAQMQCQKQKGIIKRCVIIRGHNKYTHIYHRIKSTSKCKMNHVEHTSHRRHYVSTHRYYMICAGNGWYPVDTDYTSVLVLWLYAESKHGLITLQEKSNDHRELRLAIKRT
jgi:hypothetical protein